MPHFMFIIIYGVRVDAERFGGKKQPRSGNHYFFSENLLNL